MQITQKIHTEFLPFHKNHNITELDSFILEQLPPSLRFKGVVEALTHKSFAHESKADIKDNERLEFLGDSVLQLVVTSELFERFGKVDEGKLSKLRSHLVNEKTLSILANNLELSTFVLLGNGELKADGHKKSSILANTFEAVLGAYYIEFGLDKTKTFVMARYHELERKTGVDYFSLDAILEFDAKSRLQEISQKVFGELPEYKSRELSDGNFEVSCLLAGKLKAKKVGTSKKQLMQDIAKQIIEEQKLV